MALKAKPDTPMYRQFAVSVLIAAPIVAGAAAQFATRTHSSRTAPEIPAARPALPDPVSASRLRSVPIAPAKPPLPLPPFEPAPPVATEPQSMQAAPLPVAPAEDRALAGSGPKEDSNY